jgi:hypothetical protein
VRTTHAKTVWVGEQQFLAHQALTEAATAVAARRTEAADA